MNLEKDLERVKDLLKFQVFLIGQNKIKKIIKLHLCLGLIQEI